MNIGYLIDLSHIVSQDSIDIPYLSGLHYQSIAPEDFTVSAIKQFRDEMVMHKDYVGLQIEKHIFFVIVDNDKDTIKSLSRCLCKMQEDIINFNQAQYEVHVIFNIMKEDGISIGEYEVLMPCLKNNAVCIYTWLLDRYEFSSGKPVIDVRRAHAIARLAWIVSKHRNELSLQQMHIDRSPIYNLFGDSSVFFNDEERNSAVRNYFYFKNLQHLLNLPDNKLDDYLKENAFPFRDKKTTLEKRIDSTSSLFLKDLRVPIEATLITEKTQGLLIKSSEDDNEYLINAADNKLVFIDDLSRKQQYQLKDTDTFLSDYRRKIETEQHQDTVSDEFIEELQERLIVHNRTCFDAINNEVSRSRRKQVEDFKKKIDNHLLTFLNSHDRDNYVNLSELLTPQDVQGHCSNVDKGIAFLEYLEAGKGDYLVDKEVAAGDTNLKRIKALLDEEENKTLSVYSTKKSTVEEKYKDQEDEKPSKVKSEFNAIDNEIDKHKEDIRLYNYQLEKWYDSDSVRKLTARTRSVIAFVSGLLASLLWVFFLFPKLIRPAIIKSTDPLEIASAFRSMFHSVKDVNRFEWSVFYLLLLIGVVVGLVILLRIVKRRKRSEELLKAVKERKKRKMHDRIEEMKSLVEDHYRYILAYHGQKTITELLDYITLKEEDLVSFRKTMFKLLVDYRMAIPDKAHSIPPDFNTIELNDIDVRRLIFGTDENRKTVPYCFAGGGITLSDAFENFKRKKVRLETTRFNPDFKPQEEFDAQAVANEVIPARECDSGTGIQYTALQRPSVLPGLEGVSIDDIHQGQCGDCYFMATLASIAQMNPEYIIGKNGMIQELGDEHQFFRVRFYDKDGNRVNVDVDNKFWNKNDKPIYAKEGASTPVEENSYDPWVMAVEKAWAKANNDGYDGIEGASADGKERVRNVEYSFAVTGKSAFYCMTQNVPNRDRLFEMMKKHVLVDKLPITLYSANAEDSAFTNKDPYLVCSHAYALRSVNDDGSFDIYNPWNEYQADEDVRGKHYSHVDIDFVKDNFDVVVFFGIKEADFSRFERDLTDNVTENEIAKEIEKVLSKKFDTLDLALHNMDELMTEDVMELSFINASYLFNKTRIKDDRGVNMDGQHLLYVEPARDNDNANDKMLDYLRSRGQFTLQSLSLRNDNRRSITLLRLSPHYILSSLNDL